MAETIDNWPAGSTWVFQGTVAEDATGGTHVCTLTITPGAGNEIELLYGDIINGNTATAQIMFAQIKDVSGNNLVQFLSISDTSANVERMIPPLTNPTTNVSNRVALPSLGWIVSGTMQLVLAVQTTAISVTQTFAVACRLKTGQKPTAVLADSVGTPVLTTNTNQVF